MPATIPEATNFGNTCMLLSTYCSTLITTAKCVEHAASHRGAAHGLWLQLPHTPGSKWHSKNLQSMHCCSLLLLDARHVLLQGGTSRHATALTCSARHLCREPGRKHSSKHKQICEGQKRGWIAVCGAVGGACCTVVDAIP